MNRAVFLPFLSRCVTPFVTFAHGVRTHAKLAPLILTTCTRSWRNRRLIHRIAEWMIVKSAIMVAVRANRNLEFK
jgi:hypothetical protein